jgi:polyhydroxybutyrate depolymerase
MAAFVFSPLYRCGLVFALLVSFLFTGWFGKTPVALASQRIEGTVKASGMSRQYFAWLPTDYQAKGPLPVVLAFHGGGEPAEHLEKAAAFQDSREAENFIIVYPEGVARSWNADGCCGQARDRNIDDVGFVRAILNDLESRVKIDRHRIYATGFSNGSMFSYYLACEMPDEIAAIATLSGAMQEGAMSSCRRTRPVSVLHIHGLLDVWAPMVGGEPRVKQAGLQPPVQQGLDLMRRIDATTMERTVNLLGYGECTDYYAGKQNSEVVFCKVPGMGHQWPGTHLNGRDIRIASLFGPFGPPVDASGAILRFFSQFSTQ